LCCCCGCCAAGTYAQFAAVDEPHLAKLPAAVDLSVAGGVPLVALTAWQALHVSAAASAFLCFTMERYTFV
jgi:NADPH:quinone reductase-like Zn-dependent oxidoreductase